jgi:hypothetical protein
MSAIAAVRRRRTIIAAAVGAVGLLLLPVAVVVGAQAISESRAARNVTLERITELPSTPVAYLATLDDEQQITTITVMTLAPGGRGGALVSVPVGARVEMWGAGSEPDVVRIADVYTAYGPEAFETSLEGILNLTFATGEVVERADLVRYLAPLGEVTVALPGEVVDTDDEGDMVVLPSGTQVLDPDGVAVALLARRAGEPESTRAMRIAEVWRGVSRAVAGGLPVDVDPLGVTGDPPADARSFLAAVMGGPVTTYRLSATPISSGGATLDAPDLYDLNLGETVLVFASLAPSSVTAPNPSVTMQIDSVHDFDITREAVTRLLFIGANVLVVRNLDGAAPAKTQVRSTVRLGEQERSAIGRIIGEFDLVEQDQRVEGIEVQVVLGANFVDFIEAIGSGDN